MAKTLQNIEIKKTTSIRVEPTVREMLVKKYGGVQSFLDERIKKEILNLNKKDIKKFNLERWTP